MKTTEEMVRLNQEQAKFYDDIQKAEAEKGHGGYAENKSANLLTRVWAEMRYRQQDAVRSAGVEERKYALHEKWVSLKRGGSFMEIGCFSGNVFTFPLIEAAGAYLGIELSAKAVEALREKIAEKGLEKKAEVVAGDFLLLPEDRKFDLVFAHGVLHHFENPEPLFSKIRKLLKDDGLLILTEPSANNPVYKIVRALYRPFQSDAAWEWPFTTRTVAVMEKYLEPVEGFGWGRWSLPVSVLTGIPVMGRVLKTLYLALIRKEVEAGWNPKVWQNSYVTALYRPRAGDASTGR